MRQRHLGDRQEDSQRGSHPNKPGMWHGGRPKKQTLISEACKGELSQMRPNGPLCKRMQGISICDRTIQGTSETKKPIERELQLRYPT